MLLAAIVFIPLLVLHGIYAVGERHHLLTEAGFRARALVEMAAQQHADALREDRTLLRLLSRMPEIAEADGARCRAFLSDVTTTNPQLNALAVVRPDGSTLCATPGPAAAGLAAQPWVTAALLPGAAPGRSEGVIIDAATGHPMMGLAQAIAGSDVDPRTVRGVLVARVDLGWVWAMMNRVAAADSMEIMLLDGPEQTVLAATGERPLVGRRFPRRASFDDAIRFGTPMRMAGLDDLQQVVAATPMPGARQQVLAAGMSVDLLLANMHWRALITMVGVLVVGCCVLGAAWFMARWSLLRPLGALVAAAKRLRAGDLKVRVNSRELWAPEFSELAVALNIAAMRLERNHRTLSDRANRDGLTGLASRRRFDEQLMVEWRRARRAQNHLSVLMIDVDEFKKYNDRYGHLMGDECLRQIAGSLHQCIRRPSDMVARYGGEEMVILLPETDLAGAAFMGARFLAAVQELGIVHRARPDGIMSVSIGVASVIPGDDEDPMATLVQAADEALYAAKRQGRARVVLAGEVLSGERTF